MRAKLLPEAEYGPAQGMWPGTKLHRHVINFFFNDEGLGGLINYAGATTYIARTQPHVEGRIWVPKVLLYLMEDIHREFPHFKVFKAEDATKLMEAGTVLYGSALKLQLQGKEQARQLLTSLHAHPFDVGFAYYTSTCPTPADAVLPVLDYPETDLPIKVRKLLRGGYVVFPAGGTTETRTIPGRLLNPIIYYVKELGYTPVFLGTRDVFFNNTGVTFPDDTDYSAGLDLRNETSVKCAAAIMQHAACTVGLDGGLLHLAALMKDSRIVFAYSITSVEHRAPRRNHGKTVNVALSESELICSGCQSKWKNVAVHTFDKCLPKEQGLTPNIACLEMLYENNGERFKRAIQEVLNG